MMVNDAMMSKLVGIPTTVPAVRGLVDGSTFGHGLSVVSEKPCTQYTDEIM